jgi:hypothetical protein
VRRYDNFSPHDFELFVADLLGADLGVRFETFPRGADRGVDLRYVAPNRSRPDVGQCKHYTGSSVSVLVRAAKKESGRLAQLEPKPLTYRFVTSKGLTAANKARYRVHARLSHKAVSEKLRRDRGDGHQSGWV